MTMRTFSSILPFTRRFGVRGVTCMTSGAQSGGGGNKKIGASKSRQPKMSEKDKVINAAVKILRKNPQGVQFTPLRDGVAKALPSVAPGTVHAYVSLLDRENIAGDKIFKPDVGLYRLRDLAEQSESGLPDEGREKGAKPGKTVNEARFYEPIADFLKGIDECTEAIALGGNHFGGKYNTPDVMGTLKRQPGDLIDFPIVVVSAEVKTNPDEAIVGFGQACAYRLFSHKSYLAIPNTTSENELGRVELLCHMFGIGLILFAPDSKEPKPVLKIRAAVHLPNMSHLTKNLKKIPEGKNPRKIL